MRQCGEAKVKTTSIKEERAMGSWGAGNFTRQVCGEESSKKRNDLLKNRSTPCKQPPTYLRS
jgi:hypothetical protein